MLENGKKSKELKKKSEERKVDEKPKKQKPKKQPFIPINDNLFRGF